MLKRIKKKKVVFSLKTKLLGFIISGIVVMGALFCWYYVHQSHKILTREMEKRGDAIVDNLAYNSKYGVITKNKRVLEQLLDGVMHQSDFYPQELDTSVISAVVYDANGKILAEKHKYIKKMRVFQQANIQEMDFSKEHYISYSWDEKPPVINFLVPVKTTKLVQRESDWTSDDGLLELAVEDEHLHAPKKLDDFTIGYAQISMSLQKLIDEKRAILRAGFLITLLVMGVGVVFAFAFASMLIRPIKAMTHTAINIAHGDLSLRVSKCAQDEIGVFGDCFNQMVDSLEERNREIQQLNLGLEQKVKERTKEIELANKRLQEQNIKLKENDRLKSEFLANMSHELRTPLNAIIGFSRVILKGIDGPITELQRTDLTSIHNSGKHLLALINDVLDLAKIESGKLQLQLEELDVREVSEGVLSTCQALIKDKKVKLIEEIDPDLPHIIADKTRFRQILLNILSNAIKFTYEGSITLKIKSLPRKKSILISVSDTGIGIKSEDLPKVFEKFRQVDGSSTRREGGTGLGMPITKEFVEIHGGRIWVESKFDVGSTFYVELPVNAKKSKADKELNQQLKTEKAKPYILPKGEKQQQVMVVEDDPHMMKLYQRYLSGEGYNVITLTDPTMALDEARKSKPYAIILDIMLPHKDGWEVIQELKADEQTKDIPVIISSIVNNKSMGFALGATYYLVKPFEREELLNALNGLRHWVTKIAIIDDNPQDIRLVKRMLGNHQYVYSEANNGEQGLELIRRERPDLVILDLMMPVLDGIGMLKIIRTDPSIRDIPVIVVSAKELVAQRQQELRRESNVVSFLQKGDYAAQELLTEVLNALNLCRPQLGQRQNTG
jgi:signal transduction histidine kinase/CheY-like chemotaxis protein